MKSVVKHPFFVPFLRLLALIGALLSLAGGAFVGVGLFARYWGSSLLLNQYVDFSISTYFVIAVACFVAGLVLCLIAAEGESKAHGIEQRQEAA